jgi:hypothetical protein
VTAFVRSAGWPLLSAFLFLLLLPTEAFAGSAGEIPHLLQYIVIKYAATRSSLSGKPYLVRCGESEVLTADWLKAELGRFRQAGTEGASLDRENTP